MMPMSMSRVSTVWVFLVALGAGGLVLADDSKSKSKSKDEKKADDRPRVFVTESESWSIGGELGIPEGHGEISGGARPQTAEIVKTMHDRCPDAIVTRKEERADYVLVLEHEGGKILVRKDNKFALYNVDGDAIASGSTRSLGNAIKDACEVLVDDWYGEP